MLPLERVSGDQEAHGERSETDGLVGGIDVDVGSRVVPWTLLG